MTQADKTIIFANLLCLGCHFLTYLLILNYACFKRRSH